MVALAKDLGKDGDLVATLRDVTEIIDGQHELPLIEFSV